MVSLTCRKSYAISLYHSATCSIQKVTLRVTAYVQMDNYIGEYVQHSDFILGIIKFLIPRLVDLEGANIDVTEEAMAARVGTYNIAV